MSTENEPHDAMPAKLAADFRMQVIGASHIGSPLYAELCERVAIDVERRGLCWDVLAMHAAEHLDAALALRFLGALHRLALSGEAPALAAQYPSCGGAPDSMLWPSFLATLDTYRAEVIAALDTGVQTNEVGRSAALFEALGAVQRAAGLPLSVREVGCSAGLNLAMPWFRYVDGEVTGGDPVGDVVIADRWRGSVRPRFTELKIADRAGCDPSPIDATTAAGRLLLLGFLWPDQLDRRVRTLAAIELQGRRPARIDRARAIDWLRSELADRVPDAVTVIYHSIVWQYIDRAERNEIGSFIRSVGAGATARTPLAWVRFEPQRGTPHATTTVHLWDGCTRGPAEWTVAHHGFHGQWVELQTQPS